MFRSIDGHGFRMMSLPPTFGPTSLPFSSTIAASTPKKGRVALPGLAGVAPGRGEIMMPPVSVCHQVSTIGQRPPPTFFVIPHPGLGINRFADGAKQSQRRKVMFLQPVVAPADDGPDGGRRGVENVDAVF